MRHLPTYDVFYRFFGEAAATANIAAYDRFLAPHLDAETRALLGTPRPGAAGGASRSSPATSTATACSAASSALGHASRGSTASIRAKLIGAKPRASSARFFDERLAPLFDTRLMRWATSQKVSLFGLGIPPAQYDALAAAGDGDMASVLRERLEKLACDFPLEDNYFAWQAFGRALSAPRRRRRCRPISSAANFETMRGQRRPRRRRTTSTSPNISRDEPAGASTASCCSTRRTG